MTIKEVIEQDIKAAMLSGDKVLTTTLRGLKSVILYAEVSAGVRDTGLDDQAIIALLQKEAKKRQESAVLYRSGGNEVRAQAEESEKQVIEKYLPAQLDEQAVQAIIEQEASKITDISPAKMGQLIGAVKLASNGAADGALIARLVKEYLQS